MDVSTTTGLLIAADCADEDGYRRAFDKYVAAGFRWLDYGMGNMSGRYPAFGDAMLYTDRWRRWYAEARNYCGKRNAGFNQTHNLMHNYFAGTLETETWNRLTDRAIEATALLGAAVNIMHPVAPPGKEGDVRACLRANVDFFRARGETAAKFGVTIAVENMLSTRMADGTVCRRYCDNVENLCELVDAVGMPNVKICLDTGHLHYMGEAVLASVTRIQQHLVALHIHDNDRLSDAHIAPYGGTFDWEELYRALASIRYQGFFTLEGLHACKKLPDALQRSMLGYLLDLGSWMAFNVKSRESALYGKA